MKRFVTIAILVLTFGLALCGTALADGNIYWSNGAAHSLMRVGTDGSGGETFKTGTWAPNGLAVDDEAGYVFYADGFNYHVRRCDLADGGNDVLVADVSSPLKNLKGLSLDRINQKVYFCTVNHNTVEYANYDGTGHGILVTATQEIWDVKVDAEAGKVYWIEQQYGSVNVIDTDGSNESELTAESASTMTGRYLALDTGSGTLYYTILDSNALQYGIRSLPVGGGAYTHIVTPTGAAESLDIDPGAGVVYFANGSGGDIRKVNTDGSGEATVMSGSAQINYLTLLLEEGISISDDTVPAEGDSGNTQVSFTISIPEAHDQQFSVDWSTTDGTAIAGADYVAASGTVTFTIGMTETAVSVDVLGDTLDEHDETFTVVLTNSTDLAITDDTGVCTITDDDATPSLSISDAAPVDEGNALGNSAVFTVTMTPVSGRAVTVTFDTADDTAVAGTDYTAVSGGSLTIPAGQTSGLITVTLIGDTMDEYDETFSVDLSSPMYVTLGDSSGTGTIRDDDAPPTVSIAGFTVDETESSFAEPVTVTLSALSAKNVTCTVSTVDGMAVAPGDYTALVSQTVVISAGFISDTTDITIQGDTTDEANESFTVQIDSAENATIASGQDVCTINDNDAAPVISIADVSIDEGDSGTVNAVFTVTLSAASGQTVAATAGTADSTATLGDGDYISTTTPILFPEGSTQQFFTVTINSDTQYEPSETFSVDLDDLVNCQGGAIGTGTILNDDSQPTVSISDASAVEGHSGTTPMVFTVTLSNASYVTATVSYGTSDGTALAGPDYVTTTSSAVFSPGEQTKTATVMVNGDTDMEGDETFLVTLSAPSQCTINDGAGTGTILDDDAEIAVLGKDDIEIANNDASPSVTDGTHFGSTPTSGGSVTHTFTISNPSSGQLILTGTPVVSVTLGAEDFSVAGQPPSLVPAWGSVTFDVVFDPVTSGQKSSTIRIDNSDGNENPYQYSLEGTGTAPDLAVTKAVVPVNSLYYVGERITFTIRIENQGDQSATGVLVSDTLSSRLTFAGPVSVDGASGATVALSGADLPTVASGFAVGVGETVSVTLPVTISAVGSFDTNVAQVVCDETVGAEQASVHVDKSLHMNSYVDGALGTDAPSKGTGPGADAFKTIQYALDNTKDTVRVAAGTYSENVALSSATAKRLLGGADEGELDSAVIIDGGGSGACAVVTTEMAYISGLTLQNADYGVLVGSLGSASNVIKGSAPESKAEIHFCNIISQTIAGVQNNLGPSAGSASSLKTVQIEVDATNNWWGSNDGPSGQGSGSGTAVSVDVEYDPWLGAGVASSEVETLPSGEATLDASDEAGIVVTKSGDGTPTVTVSRYDGNPQALMVDGMDLYFDVQASDVGGVDSLMVRFYMTEADLAGYFPESIEMMWWDGAAWVACSDQQLVVGTVVVNDITFAAYIEVTIDATTTPSLSDLTGTEFAPTGAQQVPPTDLETTLAVSPDPFCPGWTLEYTMVMTNTSSLTITGLVIEDVFPDSTCCMAELPGSDVAAAYDPVTNSATWNVGDMGPNDVLTLRYSLHSFESLPSGSTLTNTMTYSSTVLTEAGSVDAGALVDDQVCGATPTPTPTFTPTPEPTPTGYGCNLPLVLK